jgi:hypothetical protein
MSPLPTVGQIAGVRKRSNADDLDANFMLSIKALFAHRTIGIAMCDTETAAEDETAYLLSNPANRERLLNAIDNVRQQRHLVSVDVDGLVAPHQQ